MDGDLFMSTAPARLHPKLAHICNVCLFASSDSGLLIHVVNC
ncbi:hypothetical protein LX69_03481 [Breznakibacter xylanolyticus]|uniref:Uncharacterized protein n=1 Tax=Breznakibacter xylanolyticus TaxID=990 RepID=A0A2W7MR61_9BACT|nr:hypothetical protein LX69_03481 [Breznakibacter xylanolyticus]